MHMADARRITVSVGIGGRGGGSKNERNIDCGRCMSQRYEALHGGWWDRLFM